MSLFTITQDGALALQAAGFPGWANLQLRLATALPVWPGRHAVAADFAEPAFAGYTPRTSTITEGWVEGASGPVYSTTDVATFPGPTSGAGADIVGAFFYDSSATLVYAWMDFGGAIPLQLPTEVLQILVKLLENGSGEVFLIH